MPQDQIAEVVRAGQIVAATEIEYADWRRVADAGASNPPLESRLRRHRDAQSAAAVEAMRAGASADQIAAALAAAGLR